MTKLDKNKLFTFWFESSKIDWDVFLKLKKTKAFPQSLFFLHLTIEKRIITIFLWKRCPGIRTFGAHWA